MLFRVLKMKAAHIGDLLRQHLEKHPGGLFSGQRFNPFFSIRLDLSLSYN